MNSNKTEPQLKHLQCDLASIFVVRFSIYRKLDSPTETTLVCHDLSKISQGRGTRVGGRLDENEKADGDKSHEVGYPRFSLVQPLRSTALPTKNTISSLWLAHLKLLLILHRLDSRNPQTTLNPHSSPDLKLDIPNRNPVSRTTHPVKPSPKQSSERHDSR